MTVWSLYTWMCIWHHHHYIVEVINYCYIINSSMLLVIFIFKVVSSILFPMLLLHCSLLLLAEIVFHGLLYYIMVLIAISLRIPLLIYSGFSQEWGHSLEAEHHYDFCSIFVLQSKGCNCTDYAQNAFPILHSTVSISSTLRLVSVHEGKYHCIVLNPSVLNNQKISPPLEMIAIYKWQYCRNTDNKIQNYHRTENNINNNSILVNVIFLSICLKLK